MGSFSKTVNHLIMFFVVKKTNITTKRFINSNPLTSKLINASREIVFAGNSNINDSFGNVTLVNFHPSFTLNPMDKDFYKVAFSAAIFMFIALLITIVANSFLLLVLYIDSLRMFRNPTSYFSAWFGYNRSANSFGTRNSFGHTLCVPLPSTSIFNQIDNFIKRSSNVHRILYNDVEFNYFRLYLDSVQCSFFSS